MAHIDFNSTTLKVHYACTTLLCLKTLLMSVLTGERRHKKKVIASPEDRSIVKNGKLTYNDPDVERIRRAHRNDIENILTFVISGFFYAFTNPNPLIASLLLIVYTAARFGHTYVYVITKRQPARFLCFAISYTINIFLLASVINYTGIV